jgi:hypothetical protein
MTARRDIASLFTRRNAKASAVVWVDVTHWFYEEPLVDYDVILGVFSVYQYPQNSRYSAKLLRFENGGGQLVSLPSEFTPHIDFLYGCTVVVRSNIT